MFMLPKMDGEKFVDLSSFILFEATGDSEADANDKQVYIDNIAEDDAMSCSYDFSDNASIDDQYDAENDNGFELIEDGNVCFLEYGSDDEGEGVVNQDWRGAKMAAELHKTQKSNGCVVDSSMKLINNQREEDRLFWEACLAS